LLALIAFAFIVTACDMPTPTAGPLTPPTALPATAVPATSAPSGGGETGGAGNTLAWLSVYFTNPNPPDVTTNGVDQFVVPVLNNAKKTIDLTSFDFTLPSVADALVAAKKRGVRVRVIYDGKNGEQELKQDDFLAANGGTQPFERLKQAGIELVDGGRSNGLMHNKMIIVDSTTLFMGSWNMSYNDTFRNNNNLLQITNQKLIENYQAKFNEGFEQKLFGAKAKVTSPNPKLTINTIPVEQYFSPDDKVMDKLVAEVGQAKQSVKFMIFTYTHKNLSAAMIERFKAGVKVEGVIENRGASQGALPALFCAKIPVLTDGNKYTMHHKVIIIDDQTVITGSFNFTASADESNDDNVLIIRSKTVANAYLKEYAKIYGEGKQPDPADMKCG
jgi:phosphatidylserine/phosphatidylglycerophosphate/cardiolipin synthase-like enzyme